jgi:lipoate-protein ligase A
MTHTVARVLRAPAATLIERATELLEATLDDGVARGSWSLPTTAAIVVGSGQRLDGVAPPPGFDLLRRGTGGGAVICDPSYLMLDLALPAGDPRLGDDLAESYHWLAERLLDALAASGARGLRAVPPAELRGRGEAERASGRLACFAGLGPYELVDREGRKLVGLAQRRRRGGALFQAAAYLDGERSQLADMLGLEPGPRHDLRARLRRVATLAEVAPGFLATLPPPWLEP